MHDIPSAGSPYPVSMPKSHNSYM